MINWKLTLHKLFFMHEWEQCETDINRKFIDSNSHRPYSIQKIHTLRCKTCGTLKRKKIKL